MGSFTPGSLMPMKSVQARSYKFNPKFQPYCQGSLSVLVGAQQLIPYFQLTLQHTGFNFFFPKRFYIKNRLLLGSSKLKGKMDLF